MECEFVFGPVTGLVSCVASVATQVKRLMPAAILWWVHAGVVACQAEVLRGAGTGRRLDQLVLVIRGMWIVALQTVPNCRAVHMALNLCRILVAMALQTESQRSGGDEFHVRDVPVDADFVTTQAAFFGRGVHCLPFRLVLMTPDARRCTGSARQGRVLLRRHRQRQQHSRERTKNKTHQVDPAYLFRSVLALLTHELPSLSSSRM